MLTKKQFVSATLLCFALGFPSLGIGQSKPQSPMGSSATKEGSMGQMSPELRKDMADMYQKMADCLRTGKSMEACDQQTMKECPVIAKLGYCPIHDGMARMMDPGGKRPGEMGSMKGHQ